MVAAIIPIGLGGLFVFAFWLWAVLDCIATDGILVRNLRKEMWIMLVIFLPTAGAIAWLLLGRPEGAGMSIGGSYRPPDYTRGRSRARGFEDSDDWEAAKADLPKPSHPNPAPSTDRADDEGDTGESDAVRERRLMEWEAELKRREAALDDHPDTD